MSLPDEELRHRETGLDRFPPGRTRHSPRLEDFILNHPAFDPREDPLLDIRPAHRWFSQLDECVRAGTYIFQKVLQDRQGLHTRADDRPLRVFSSYDYLSLIGHPDIDDAAVGAIRQFGTGTGGVRLLAGTNELHDQLEHALLSFKRTESAVVFTSGYVANLTALAGLFDNRDVAYVDEYIHRSIVDAARLAGVRVRFFAHNNAAALRALLEERAPEVRRRLIIIEGIYSMDGDIAPLPDFVALKQEFGAFLMVDEAHSLGVLGREGRGLDEYWGVDPAAIDIFTGSLSKAIPSNGGFIAAREEVIHFLKHGGAPFMFSAALSPPNAAAALAALAVIRREGHRIGRLWSNAGYLQARLRSIGAPVGMSASPVVPLICGSNERAFTLSRHLYDDGFLATAVIYPAVPPEMARIRLCATADMNAAVIDAFVDSVRAFQSLSLYADR